MKGGRLDFTSRVIGGFENEIGLKFSPQNFFPYVPYARTLILLKFFDQRTVEKNLLM